MRLIVLGLVAAALATAQVEDGTVWVSSVQTISLLRADEVQVTLYVTADAAKGIDGVLQAFSGIALRADELASISTRPGTGLPETMDCVFLVRRPLAKINELVRALIAVSRNTENGLTISYSLTGSVSQAAQERQVCAFTTLLADARTRAEQAASAAGVRVGDLLQVTDGSAPAGIPTGVVPTAIARIGVPGSGPFPLSETITRTTSCAAVAQFKLLR